MNPAGGSRTSKAALVAVSVLAVVAFALPTAWFKSGKTDSEAGIWLETKRDLPGRSFQAQRLSEGVYSSLGTTNVLNGTFEETGKGQRVTAFSSSWLPLQGAGRTIVNHTPDVCWVGAGWKPVSAGQPSQLTLPIGGQDIPFECRAFEAPQGGGRELTLWCTLVNGEILPEPFQFGSARGGRLASMFNLSRLAVGRLWERILSRKPANGHKQFVRFSVPLHDDVEEGLKNLRRFGTDWITARPLTTHGSM